MRRASRCRRPPDRRGAALLRGVRLRLVSVRVEPDGREHHRAVLFEAHRAPLIAADARDRREEEQDDRDRLYDDAERSEDDVFVAIVRAVS